MAHNKEMEILEERNPGPVALDGWAVLLVKGGDYDHKPFSCFNCHMLIEPAKRCAIHGPKIIIDSVEARGKTWNPVCGLWDGGKPMEKEMYPASDDPDMTGLEWVLGKGTNCGGMHSGRGCSKHYLEESSSGNGSGFCRVIQRDVEGTDCCGANESLNPAESMDWREAQGLLKKEKSNGGKE